MTPPSLPYLPRGALRMSGGHKGVGSWSLFLWAVRGPCDVLSGDKELHEGRNHVRSVNPQCPEQGLPRSKELKEGY